jgi:undecaprenyl diphosphate synthase
LGRKTHLDKDIVEKLNSLEEETKDFTDFTVALAMDYGGHDELLRAIKKIKEQGLEFTEENIEKNLDTHDMPPIDFIIRTSGEQRLSGFMSWQCQYAELYFPKEPFPAFDVEDLEKAFEDYAKRDRRFGGDTTNENKYLE